jgi:hypothetical protein
MKKIIFFSGLLIGVNTTFAQGLKLDPEKYKSAEQYIAPKEHGFSAASLPAKISYRDYCPKPNSQGDISTCVGWAAAYGALSTQLNIQMGITNLGHKWARKFDPHFIYSFVKKENDQWCQEGASLSNALLVLEQYGCKPMIWEPWLKCNDNTAFSEFTLQLASQYKIEDWKAIPNEDLVENTKMALYNKLPVLVGVALTESFMKGTALGNGLWTPKAGEELIGGHAMCVIGYDNNKNGGAFEVLNSYGEEYGDKGFVWIGYKDFANLVGEAYVMKTTTYKTGSCSFGDCLNTYSRFKFNNGDIYEGVIKNYELDIYGSMLYNGGSFYVGGWKKGRKDGWGLLYDVPSSKFYNVYYKDDVLVEHTEKKFGFAQSESDKKVKENLDQLIKSLPEKEKPISDFETVQKVLSKYEAPDKPIKVEKDK